MLTSIHHSLSSYRFFPMLSSHLFLLGSPFPSLGWLLFSPIVSKKFTWVSSESVNLELIGLGGLGWSPRFWVSNKLPVKVPVSGSGIIPNWNLKKNLIFSVLIHTYPLDLGSRWKKQVRKDDPKRKKNNSVLSADQCVVRFSHLFYEWCWDHRSINITEGTCSTEPFLIFLLLPHH